MSKDLQKTPFSVGVPPEPGYIWVVRGNKIFQRRRLPPKDCWTRWTPVTAFTPAEPVPEIIDWNPIFRASPRVPDMGGDFDWNFMLELVDVYENLYGPLPDISDDES